MSESKHTPGPWDAFATRSRIDGTVLWHISASEAGEHPDDYTEVGGDFIRKVDADLCAAAPDLLAACKAVYEKTSLSRQWRWVVPQSVLDEVFKAIAKAEPDA